MKVSINTGKARIVSRTILGLLAGVSMTGCAATEVFYLDTVEGACYRYADDDHPVGSDNYKQVEC